MTKFLRIPRLFTLSLVFFASGGLPGTFKLSESFPNKETAETNSLNELGESEEIPVPWLDNSAQISQQNGTSNNSSVNDLFDPYKKFNSDDIYDFPELVPVNGNVSDVKWRESHWENKHIDLAPDGYNVTEGNWSKGYRHVGHWVGRNKTEGTWLEEGLYKGMWSLTKHLGKILKEIFWTQQLDNQLNITMNGKDISHFLSGNFSQGNSTREVGFEDPNSLKNVENFP